jgi:hypothetical protein
VGAAKCLNPERKCFQYGKGLVGFKKTGCDIQFYGQVLCDYVDPSGLNNPFRIAVRGTTCRDCPDPYHVDDKVVKNYIKCPGAK